MQYSQFVSQIGTSGDQKDLIISRLKAEVHELSQNEKDFEDITNSLKNLEHRYSLLKDDKVVIHERQASEFKARQDASMQNMAGLRTDVDTLKSALSQKSIECQEHVQDNMQWKDMCDKMSYQMQDLKNSLVQLQNTQKKSQQMNRELEGNLDQQIIASKRLQEDLDNVQNQLEDALYKGIEKDKIIKEHERDIALYQRDQQDMQAALEELSTNLKTTTKQLRYSEEQCSGAQKAILALEADIVEMDKLQAKTREECKKRCQDVEERDEKIHQHKKQLYEAEDIIKNQEDNCAEKEKQIAQLQLINQQQDATNYSLNQDIDNLHQQIQKLQSVNRDLLFEIENINQQDEEIRKLINRRNRLEQIKLNAEKQVASTMSQVTGIVKSPARRRLQSTSNLLLSMSRQRQSFQDQ